MSEVLATSLCSTSRTTACKPSPRGSKCPSASQWAGRTGPGQRWQMSVIVLGVKQGSTGHAQATSLGDTRGKVCWGHPGSNFAKSPVPPRWFTTPSVLFTCAEQNCLFQQTFTQAEHRHKSHCTLPSFGDTTGDTQILTSSSHPSLSVG